MFAYVHAHIQRTTINRGFFCNNPLFMGSQRVRHNLPTEQQLFPDVHRHLPSAQFGKQSTLATELPSPNLLQIQKTYEVPEIQMRKQT